MRFTPLLALMAAVGLSTAGAYQEKPKQEGPKADAPKKASKEAVHEELRALKTVVVEAFNKKDIDALLKHLTKDVIVTWQNGEVSRGHDGVRDYYERMLVGDKSVVLTVQAEPEVAKLSELFADDKVALAFGNLNDSYTLRDGMKFKMNSLWSATLVKEDGKWLIANFHASVNAFDNGILEVAVKKSMMWGGLGGIGVGVLVGIVIAFVIGKMMGKPKTT